MSVKAKSGSGGEIHFDHTENSEDSCLLTITNLNQNDTVFFAFLDVRSTGGCGELSRTIEIDGKTFCDGNRMEDNGGVRVDITLQSSITIKMKNANANTGIGSIRLYYVGKFTLLPSKQ